MRFLKSQWRVTFVVIALLGILSQASLVPASDLEENCETSISSVSIKRKDSQSQPLAILADSSYVVEADLPWRQVFQGQLSSVTLESPIVIRLLRGPPSYSA